MISHGPDTVCLYTHSPLNEKAEFFVQSFRIQSNSHFAIISLELLT